MAPNNFSSYWRTNLNCSCRVCHSAGEEEGMCAGSGGTTGVCLGPHQDSQQWALTFQCGFVCLCLDLKGHCISICILLLFIGGCSIIKTCLNMGTPDGMRTHSQLMPKVSVSLLLVLSAMAALSPWPSQLTSTSLLLSGFSFSFC